MNVVAKIWSLWLPTNVVVSRSVPLAKAITNQSRPLLVSETLISRDFLRCFSITWEREDLESLTIFLGKLTAKQCHNCSINYLLQLIAKALQSNIHSRLAQGKRCFSPHAGHLFDSAKADESTLVMFRHCDDFQAFQRIVRELFLPLKAAFDVSQPYR